MYERLKAIFFLCFLNSINHPSDNKINQTQEILSADSTISYDTKIKINALKKHDFKVGFKYETNEA